jgi:arsenite-transporting ATPase
VLAALERRRDRIGQLHRILTDRSRTSFVLVTIPERLAIEETVRAGGQVTDSGMDLGGLVVNRVLPEGLEGEFFHSRKAQERTYLEEIERRFRRVPRVFVEQLPRDVYGFDPLGIVSRQLIA